MLPYTKPSSNVLSMEFCPRRRREVSRERKKSILAGPDPCLLNFRANQRSSQASPLQLRAAADLCHGTAMDGTPDPPHQLELPQSQLPPCPPRPTSRKFNRSWWFWPRLFSLWAVAGVGSRIRTQHGAPQKGRGQVQHQPGFTAASPRALLATLTNFCLLWRYFSS